MKNILAVFLTVLLALFPVITIAYTDATLHFDGPTATISPSDWRWLDPEDSPADWETVGVNLDSLNWQARISNIIGTSQASGLLRIDFILTERGAGRAPLFVIETPSAEHFVLAAMQDGKLFKQWELGSKIPVMDKERPSTHSAIPLEGLKAGRVSILIRATTTDARFIIRSSAVYDDIVYGYQQMPLNTGMSAGYLGSLITYLTLISALALYYRRSEYLYALLFVGGAVLALTIREGILFNIFKLHNTWIYQNLLSAAVGLSLAGAILFVRNDLRASANPKLVSLVSVAGWFSIGISLFGLAFKLTSYPWLALAGLTSMSLGILLCIALMLHRAYAGNLRERCFAVIWTAFLLTVLGRFYSGFVFNSILTSTLMWNTAITCAAAWIFIEYVLIGIREIIRAENEKTVDSTRIDLVNRLSHELRTPLNAIIGLADLLKDSNEREKVSNYAGMIQDAGNNLLGLVNDILDFSKLEENSIHLIEEPIRLDQLLNEASSGFIPRTLETGIVPETIIAPNIPFYVLGDSIRIKQIITNLLSNALKFSTSGGKIKIQVKQGNQIDDRVELLWSITDNGRGIPAEKIGSIFEPYFQSKAEDSVKLQGTGLGLTITKMLVEEMGGSISVESEPGRHTTFNFNLWLKRDPNAPDIKSMFAPLRNKNILLISKFPAISELFATYFKHHGANISLCKYPTKAPAPGYDMVIADTVASCNESDIEWFNQLPAQTLIHFVGLEQSAWTKQLRDGQVPTLIMPCALLTMIARFTETMTGTTITDMDNDKTETQLEENNHHVLLVDDNTVNLTVTSKLLSSLGINCTTAQGGKSALSKLQTNHDYSLVLMDCEMPDLDGFEVTAAFRQYEASNNLKPLAIVALTAHALNEVNERCLQAGMDEVMYKPIGKQALVQLLNRYSDKRDIHCTT